MPDCSDCGRCPQVMFLGEAQQRTLCDRSAAPAARRERLLSSAERTIAEAAAVIAALKNAAS